MRFGNIDEKRIAERALMLSAILFLLFFGLSCFSGFSVSVKTFLSVADEAGKSLMPDCYSQVTVGLQDPEWDVQCRVR